MTSSLHVLIAAAGKPTLLKRTLAWLAACEKPATYGGTIIVENGPRCGIEEVVRGFPRDHRFQHLYVTEPNKSHALNVALARLNGGLVFMTDDDVRLDGQVLVAYAEAAQNRARGEFYGGPVEIDAEHGLPPEWLRRFYPQTIAERWSLPHTTNTEVSGPALMGTNWAAFADDLVAAGGFDSRLGPGGTSGAAGQETEMQRRLIAGGARPIYVPGAIAWHYLHREFLEREWIFKRAYKHALEWGVRRTRSGQSPLLPIVRGAIGVFNARLKGAVLRMLGGEQRRFEAEFHETKWRGRWDGLWLGRRWDALPQFHVSNRSSDLSRAA